MDEKSNEIVAIPELLDKIQVKGQIVTIDAMGTQKAIAEKIRKKRADYVLAVKGSRYKDSQESGKGHWNIESMHWHLDVTFREDANTTLNKQAVQNQNIIRKWSLSILKMIELMKPGLSMKKKRFAISLRPVKYLEEVLSF